MAQFVGHVNPGVEAGDAIRQAIAMQEAKRMQMEALQRQAQLDAEKVREFNASNSLNERQVANAERGTSMRQSEMDLAAKDRSELMSMLNPQPEEGAVGVQSPIPAKPVAGMGSVSMSPNPITVKGLRPAQSNGIPENVRKSVLLQLHGANVPASAFNEPKPENTSDYQDKLSRYAVGIGKTLQTLTSQDQLAFDKQQAEATRAPVQPPDPLLEEERRLNIEKMRREGRPLDVTSEVQTTLSGNKYLDLGEFQTPTARESARQAAKAAGVIAVDKTVGDALRAADNAKLNMQAMWARIESKLPRDAAGRIIAGPQNKLSAYFQTDDDLASFSAWRTGAIQAVQALVERGMGFRLNQAEINMIMANDQPQLTDTYGTAKNRIEAVITLLDNKEKAALTRDRSSLNRPTESQGAATAAAAKPKVTVRELP